MNDLLKTLADRRCRVVLTFPKDTCSNGLSGNAIEEMARASFEVARKSVKTRFSAHLAVTRQQSRTQDIGRAHDGDQATTTRTKEAGLFVSRENAEPSGCAHHGSRPSTIDQWTGIANGSVLPVRRAHGFGTFQ